MQSAKDPTALLNSKPIKMLNLVQMREAQILTRIALVSFFSLLHQKYKKIA